jgi:hypothetical protein
MTIWEGGVVMPILIKDIMQEFANDMRMKFRMSFFCMKRELPDSELRQP